MSRDPGGSGQLSPWLFLAGLLLFLGSIALFVFDLATGRDVLRAIALNGAAAAVLMAWAAHDTLTDPDSAVDSTGGAAGTALLLYGVYLLVSGAVITVTAFWHTRLTVGLWYLALAVGTTLVGYLIFPTGAIAARVQTDAADAYERADDACATAADDIEAGRYERASERYGTVQSAVADAVDSETLTGGDGDEPGDEAVDHAARATALVDNLLEQATAATDAGRDHLEADAYAEATAAFETATAALEAAADVTAAAELDRDVTERKAGAEAWLAVAEGLATAEERARAGGVAAALKALDEAESAASERDEAETAAAEHNEGNAAASERRRELLDRKQGVILGRIEMTRRETAVERLRTAAESVEERSVTGTAEAATALTAAAAAASQLDTDGVESDRLRERTATWTEVTALLTGGQQALEADDHEGLLGLLEAALLALRVCERAGVTGDPDPRTVAAWLRGCERIMETYGRAMNAVETAETQHADGNDGAARSAYSEARKALDAARATADDAGIDAAAIEAELSAVNDRLDALGSAN